MSQLPAVPSAPTRAPLQRRTELGVIAGVASGVAEHLGVNVRLVRFGFVIASLFSGIGLLAYGVLWVLLPNGLAQPEAAGLEAASRRGMRPEVAAAARPDNGVMIAGGLLVVGLLWLFVAGGVVPTGLFWPMIIGGVGIIVIWLQVDERVTVPRSSDKRSLWARVTRGGGTMSVVRLIGGLVLVGGGLSWTLAAQIGLAQLPAVLGASALLLAGLFIVGAPWLYQQRNRLRRVDAERHRAEARADMAAHLHDSVLQTLALIQRQSDDSAAVAQLARRQERELRTWLYGETARAASLRSALQQLALDVEGRFAVDVELVCVGDATVDDRVEALIQAAGEAVTNAAKHSGADRIDVYAEVDDGAIEVFIRDRGKGFDPDQVPDGRMGVRESIRARMERYGGSAMVRSEPGEGTNVKLEMSG